MNARAVDFNGLLQANLDRVFGERDAAKRHAAIRELYAPDAVLYEPDDIATGHDAIAHAVDALLTSLPPTFVFKAIDLPWPGPRCWTGPDHKVLHRIYLIKSLHVFIDPPGA